MSYSRIGLITTLGRNIGDDFIRDGIVQILSSVLAGRDVHYLAVNKHHPFTVYPDWHPLRWLQGLDRLPRGRRAAERMKADLSRALYRLGGSRFDHTDLIIQCGMPVMWPGCHRCEWALPLWDQVVGRLSERIQVLNLAAGSCYPWEDQPQALTNPADSGFLGRILGYCRVTTARDELASRLAKSLGASVPTIPCSALLVGRRFQVPRVDEDGFVLFNYVRGAGRFQWGQGIDEQAWKTKVKALIQRISSRHRVAFICHGPMDFAAAQSVDPSVPRFMPATIEEYFSLISQSKAAICNRLHAAVALAGLGIPSVSIGTDTRMLMIRAIGLPYRYVKDASVEQLEEDLETSLKCRMEERDRLIELREWTWTRYVTEVTKALAA